MINFKHKKDVRLFSALHPILIMIFADLWNYAYEKHGVMLTVTSTVSTSKIDKLLKRVSKSHVEKRAIDIQTVGVNSFVLNDCLNYINNKKEYKKYHYLSKSGFKRLAFWHVTDAEHIHMALHSSYKL